MGRTMTLEVPESIYEPLAKTAELRGRMPEQLALEWLVSALHIAADDPVENFIGAFVSDIPDWTDRHDEYGDWKSPAEGEKAPQGLAGSG